MKVILFYSIFHLSSDLIENYFDNVVDPETTICSCVGTKKKILFKDLPKTDDRELIDAIVYF